MMMALMKYLMAIFFQKVQQGHDLKSLLRGGAGDEAIRDAIAAVWRARDDRYSEIRTAETAKSRKVEMSYIGG